MSPRDPGRSGASPAPDDPKTSDESDGLPVQDVDDDDLGHPLDLGALTGLHHGPDLLERLRARIERRQVTGDFARLFWAMPGALLRGVLWGLSPGQPSEIKDESERDDHG